LRRRRSCRCSIWTPPCPPRLNLPGIELRDGDLLLRSWRVEDAEAVHRICQDREIARWMPVIPQPYTLDDARVFVSGELGLGPHSYAVEQDGELVASIGLRLDHRGNGEIGYWCAAEARGRGVVTRAVRLVCRFAFEELGIGRLEIVVDSDNLASRRVAERAGFQQEGVLRSHLTQRDGGRCDGVMYSLLPGDPA
jgi:RimJ/RimL family protein N-acetyltransferase